jgi:hypothetical protein
MANPEKLMAQIDLKLASKSLKRCEGAKAQGEEIHGEGQHRRHGHLHHLQLNTIGVYF